MPIKDGTILSGPAQSIVQNAFNRDTAVLTGALNNAFRAARSDVNLQGSQGSQLLSVIRSDRNFREQRRLNDRNFDESRFRDRRNFGRRVITEDRNFAEGVRRFNAQDQNADQALALRAELGRGNLSIRGAVSEAQIGQIEASTEATRFRNATAQTQQSQRDEYLEAFRILNDPEEYKRFNPDATDQDRINDIQALRDEALALGLGDVAKGTFGLNQRAVQEAGGEPDVADKAIGAETTFETGIGSLETDPEAAAIHFAEAESLYKQAGDEAGVARAKQAKENAQARAKDRLNDTNTGPDGKITPKGKTAVDPLSKLGFANGQDALQTAFRIKDETGISELSITNAMGEFASRFANATEFRNALLAVARREGKGDDVTITPKQAQELFNAEEFRRRASTPNRPTLDDPDVDGIFKSFRK